MQRKKIVNLFKVIFFFSIGFLLIWLSIKDLTVEQKKEILNSFRQADYFWVIIAMFVGIGSHLTRALRWRLLFEPLGYNPKISNTFFSVMLGYLFNLAVPRLGEITRCGAMSRYEKTPFNKALGTVVTERTFDMLTFFFILFITLLFEYNRVSGYLKNNILNKLEAKLPGIQIIMLVGVVLAIIFIVLFILFHKKLSNYKLFSKIIEIIKGFWEGIKSIFKLKRSALFILLTFLLWGCYYLMAYLCFFALEETASLSPLAGLSILALGSIAMMVTPGGIGLYPIIAQGVLLLYMVPATKAYALGWIIWTSQNVTIVLAGVLSWLLLYFLNEYSPSDNNLKNG